MVMQLLGSLGGSLLQQRGGQAMSQGTQMPFKSHVGITMGDALYDTMAEVLAIIGALAAGSVWTKIWEMTVAAQQKIRWGFGSPTTPHNQGYMWFCSIDEGTDIQVGVLRLVQANARETINKTVLEVDDSRLHLAGVTSLLLNTPTSINDMMALPEKVEFPRVGEDSMLQLFYRCIVAATAEDDCAFSIPVTVYQ